MTETEFNLLDEPWIRVLGKDCVVREVSLTDALVNAHDYASLCGELATQDVAVMRLLLAVLHTVFSRADADGNEAYAEESDEVLERWRELYESKRFPDAPIRDYLNRWHERFWLFHPQRPFYQIAGLDVGTTYDAPKLNGELSESTNKTRLFSSFGGSEKSGMSYSQAARWLLYVNAYDDTSAKPTKSGKAAAAMSGVEMQSTGVGWLGKLGLVTIGGDSLFQTLMLNMVMLNGDELWAEEKPLWEKENVSSRERTRIAIPDNLSELYTVQSRRLSLIRNDDRVTGYRLLGGDFFEKENAFVEPMTVWRYQKDKTKDVYTPRRHDEAKQIWREFSSYITDSSVDPGVVVWNKALLSKGILPRGQLCCINIASVKYGDKDFFVNHVFSDSMSFHRQLLSDIGKRWQENIRNEIEKCELIAKAAGYFAKELYLAGGGDPETPFPAMNNAKEQLYYRLDEPFRKWLVSINPDEDFSRDNEKRLEWRTVASAVAAKLINELAELAGENAIVGRTSGGRHYSAPEAVNRFYYTLREIYKEGGSSNERNTESAENPLDSTGKD